MARLDDPRARILRLFQMEEREGRGGDCERFEAGVRPPGVPLEEDELVHGIYKGKYFFTPRALIQASPDGFERIPWREIRSCSSKHGEGMEVANLVLIDGTTTQVQVGDFAKGWSGRISQLFHQLIEKHGAAASFGAPLYSVDDFFAAARGPDDFLPNLEPQMTLDQARAALRELEREPGVTGVLLRVVAIEGGSPVADGVVVRGEISAEALSEFAKSYGADGVLEAPEDIKRKLGTLFDGEHAWLVVWD